MTLICLRNGRCCFFERLLVKMLALSKIVFLIVLFFRIWCWSSRFSTIIESALLIEPTIYKILICGDSCRIDLSCPDVTRFYEITQRWAIIIAGVSDYNCSIDCFFHILSFFRLFNGILSQEITILFKWADVIATRAHAHLKKPRAFF